MPKANNNSYDVIIIGAGISGLVCGCYLAKAGMKVLIIEQHYKPGGYCSSFRRKGLLFDAAAHSFGSYRESGNFRKILTELDITKIVKIKRFDPSDVVITPDFKVTFWNHTKKTIGNLVDIFPNQKDNIQAYFSYYDSLPFRNQLENIKLKDKTYASFLDSFFTDKRLINSISFPVLGNGGLPPSLLHAFTGTKIFGEFLLDGGYYTEGGIQNLPNALDSMIRQHNGRILYRSLVRKILCRNNIAVGIELETNKQIYSKYVISACDVTQTLKSFLGGEIIGTHMADNLKNMIPSISTFILYLGINKPFKELPQRGVNTWYLPNYDLEGLFHQTERCDFDNTGYMIRVSPDMKTILAFFGAPFKTKTYWKKNKKRIAEDFLKRIEKQLIPNLREHIIYFDAATPHTLYRYTLNYKGANYGWAPLQSQLFDPDFRQKSFIKGLYLTGHWTTQTHGIPGVAYLGYSTAKLILKRENIGI